MVTFRGNTVEEVMLCNTPVFSTLVPSDTTTYPQIRAIFCVTAGTLVAQNSVGANISIPMNAGATIGICPVRIMAATTGTYVILQ
jgi:hypothetical protein